MEATITSKGQVTLPKAFRERHNLKVGEKLVFIEDPDGNTRIIVRRNDIDALIGLLKPPPGVKGYEGEACGECGNYTLVRNGTCMKCNTCGSTSGCS